MRRLSFLRYGRLATGVGVLLVILGWWPSEALGGPRGTTSLLLAAGISVVAALAGRSVHMALIRLAPGGQEPATAPLAGLGARLLLSLVAVLIVVRLEPFPLMTFAIQIAVAYLALLCLEVFVNLRELGEHQPRTGPVSDGSGGSTSNGSSPPAPDDGSGDQEGSRVGTSP
jgi:hypothetical protein